MPKSVKEIYNHNLNRINRLDKKIKDFKSKKDVCEVRIKKVVLKWIKRNHKEWLEDVLSIQEIPLMDITLHKDKIGVKFYKMEWNYLVRDVENCHYVDYTIKVSELS